MSTPEIGQQQVTISCPSCGRQVRVQLADFRHRRTVRCSAGHMIELQEERPGEIAKADRELRKFNHEIDKLNRSLRRLGR